VETGWLKRALDGVQREIETKALDIYTRRYAVAPGSEDDRHRAACAAVYAAALRSLVPPECMLAAPQGAD
jgi:hypothetical protein